MKLLLTTRMGDPYFGLLDDLTDVQKVWATTPDDIAREIVEDLTAALAEFEAVALALEEGRA